MLPLWDSQNKGRKGGMTGLLVSLCLIVFLGEMVLAWWRPDALDQVIGRWGWVPAAWWPQRGEWTAWLPLVTSIFLHGGLAHAAGNAWFLWVFGRSLESHVGTGRFIVVFGVGAVAAAMAQTLPNLQSSVPMIGASGAISAVMGAYLVLMPWRWIIALVPWIVPVVPLPAVVYLILWFLAQLINGWGSLDAIDAGGVAWWAHAGGFVSGAALAGLIGKNSSRKPKRKRRKVPDRG